MLALVSGWRCTGGAVVVVAALALLAGCGDAGGIDGSQVPKVGSTDAPPTCAQVCDRLEQLCGVRPLDCTLEDAGGYCDTVFDDTHRVCVGQAETCQIADECENAAEPDDAGADDAALVDDAAPADDAAADAAAE